LSEILTLAEENLGFKSTY